MQVLHAKFQKFPRGITPGPSQQLDIKVRDPHLHLPSTVHVGPTLPRGSTAPNLNPQSKILPMAPASAFNNIHMTAAQNRVIMFEFCATHQEV
jgi:hypothetical protein